MSHSPMGQLLSVWTAAHIGQDAISCSVGGQLAKCHPVSAPQRHRRMGKGFWADNDSFQKVSNAAGFDARNPFSVIHQMCQLPPKYVAFDFYPIHLRLTTFARTFPESWFWPEGGGKG